MFLAVWSVTVCLILLFVLNVLVPADLRQQRTLAWPESSGEIVREAWRPNNEQRYRGPVYRYTTPSGTFESERLRLDMVGTTQINGQNVDDMKRRGFKVGQRVSVRYDPSDHSKSLLEAGLRSSDLIAYAVTGAFMGPVLIALSLAVHALWIRFTGPPLNWLTLKHDRVRGTESVIYGMHPIHAALIPMSVALFVTNFALIFIDRSNLTLGALWPMAWGPGAVYVFFLALGLLMRWRTHKHLTVDTTQGVLLVPNGSTTRSRVPLNEIESIDIQSNERVSSSTRSHRSRAEQFVYPRLTFRHSGNGEEAKTDLLPRHSFMRTAEAVRDWLAGHLTRLSPQR